MTDQHTIRSVYTEALGTDIDRLKPEVREYVVGPGEQGIGVGTGVFESAGTKFGRLTWLAMPVVGPAMLLDRHEKNVPFTILNQPGTDEHGAPTLAAFRLFRFRRVTRAMSDIILAGPTPGTLRNRVGTWRVIEIILRCTATERGHLSLRSEECALRLGPLRLRLPRLLGVSVRVEDGWDAENNRRTVQVLVTNPLLGTVTNYRGHFTYSLV
ncbi:DUF4166 domain-containing protein [Mycetocola lacteus]|uniref:DUF4166 domain-containing protein n=1 Tax=Mycetocola lacteus TaxID=76637 RepID=A0A3L7AVR2_9MICO|nr:DUF4166 domain-containing protein [Mycetocola lacteus]RLP80681.1 DUF4166 domain-containing protein [Mycetocola lacteus]RLP84466.1 DUF4166 domain-containing protein [Mycetocola lacteus]